MRMWFSNPNPWRLWSRREIVLTDGVWKTDILVEFMRASWVAKNGDQCVVNLGFRDAIVINGQTVASVVSLGWGWNNPTYEVANEDIHVWPKCATHYARNSAGRLWMLTTAKHCFSRRQDIVCLPSRPELWNALVGIAIRETLVASQGS